MHSLKNISTRGLQDLSYKILQPAKQQAEKHLSLARKSKNLAKTHFPFFLFYP